MEATEILRDFGGFIVKGKEGSPSWHLSGALFN